jgi:hypothetical protein
MFLMMPQPVVPLVLMIAAGLLAACSSPQISTTRLSSADLVAMTDRMAASLRASPAVASRSADAAPWFIAIDRLVNQSSDIVPDGQKRAFLARLRALLSQTPALAQRQIIFIASADRRDELSSLATGVPTDSPRPTHELIATLYSVSSADPRHRSDAYLAAFSLLDLATAQVLWEDSYEVKRAVMRNELD